MRSRRLPFRPTAAQIQEIRRLVEVERLQMWMVAERMDAHQGTLFRLCKTLGIKVGPGGARRGSDHHGWKGGRIRDKHGYILVYTPGHPHARKWGKQPPCYMAEHRLVVEKSLGRYLLPTEVVHHKNGVKTDNRLENLELFQTNADRLRHELTGRCPKWTEDGKARILAGVERAKANARQRKAAGALSTPQS